MKQIRIAHILYSFGVGGLEGMLARLINHMDPGIFSHDIITISEDLGSLAKVTRKDVGAHVIKRLFPNDPSTVVRLALELKRLRPDIVRTYNWTGIEGVAAAKLSGCRAVIHSEHGFDSTEIALRKPRRVVARRLLLSNVSKVIAVSQGLKQWLIEDVKVPADKVLYIPNGCDVKDFRPGREPELRRTIGIADTDMVIGTVGSLTEVKGHRYLMEAFAQCLPAFPRIRLMIAGEGPLRGELERLAQKLAISEKTIFTGRIIDPEPYFRAMDIFILPSLSENMPNSLMEAMATGLPIIATDVGDVRYMLDGEMGGMVVNPKDAEAMAGGIRYFFGHPDEARRKGESSRRRIGEEFAIERITDIYEKLFTTLSG